MRKRCQKPRTTEYAQQLPNGVIFCRILHVAHALAVIGNRHGHTDVDPAQVALVALFHDASEVLTGDPPTPVKYANPSMRAAYKRLEEAATGRLLRMLPLELQPDYALLLSPEDPEVVRLVKAADKLCAYLKAVPRSRCGQPRVRTGERGAPGATEGVRARRRPGSPRGRSFFARFHPPLLVNLWMNSVRDE